MKLILENWRKYLTRTHDIPGDIHPKIEKQIQNLLELPPDIIITITELEPDVYMIGYVNEKKLGEPRGEITIVAADGADGQCLGGYIVYISNATRGWGPLLYEVAIELASSIGNGLTPDRGSVSMDATAVWDKYAKRADVIKKQLDVAHGKHWSRMEKIPFPDGDTEISPNEVPQITPEYEYDDCDQRMALKWGGYKWGNTPHSKLYTKRNTPVIQFLNKAKRLKLPK
tara:strand:+ start:1045 stop:1728 length:684 start_codon:yes stop_codon:yes gene_type:complete